MKWYRVKSQRWESNPQPPHYECGALPIEATLARTESFEPRALTSRVRSRTVSSRSCGGPSFCLERWLLIGCEAQPRTATNCRPEHRKIAQEAIKRQESVFLCVSYPVRALHPPLLARARKGRVQGPLHGESGASAAAWTFQRQTSPTRETGLGQ